MRYAAPPRRRSAHQRTRLRQRFRKPAPVAMHYARALPSRGRLSPRSCVQCYERSCVKDSPWTGQKKGGALRLRLLVVRALLNGNDALHVQSEVWHTVKRVLAGLDLGKRHRNRLTGVHLHVAGELTHFVGAHIGVELRFDVGRNGGGVERHIVWAAANYYELDSVTLLYGDVGGLEAISLGITHHVDRLGGAGGRSHCYCTPSCPAGGGRRGRGRRRCGRWRRGGIGGDVCGVGRVLIPSVARPGRTAADCYAQ